MKKAKLLWIIYFCAVGVVALFFTLFINQGVGGTFTVTNKKGEIKLFNSYLFIDYNKLGSNKKSRYSEQLAKYKNKSKKQTEVAAADTLIKKINSMLEIIKNRDEVADGLKKKLDSSKKNLSKLKKTAAKARGGRKKTLTKRVENLEKSISKIQSDIASMDVKVNEAKEIASNVRKRMKNDKMSDVDALLSERTRLSKLKKTYERTKAAYERELMQLKKYIDVYRIEKIVSAIANSRVSSSGEIPSDKMNLLPATSMEFIVGSQDIEKNIPDSIGLKPVPTLNSAGIQELQSTTVENLNDQIEKKNKSIADTLKKIRNQGTSDNLKEQLKNAKADLKTLRKKLQDKKILQTIVSSYSELINKSVELYKEYYREIENIIQSEGMPIANFVTTGIYLGNYAKDFKVYGEVVKNHIDKGKMKLKGIHRIEERLIGSRAQVRQNVNSKVFGVGEILTFRLKQTELDLFINGFESLKSNVKFRLEQGGSSTFTATGTSGGGGQINLPAVNPDGGGLPAVNPDGGGSGGGGQTDLPAVNPDGGGSGDSSAKPSTPDAGGGPEASGPLTKKEMNETIELANELAGIYDALKPFFGAEKVYLTAGVISDVYKSITKLIKFMDNLKNKHAKILNQKTIDSSDTGMGMEIVIRAKFDNAYNKIQKVNAYIKDNIIELTEIQNSGTITKRIFIILLMLAGAFLAYLTFIWEKKQESTE